MIIVYVKVNANAIRQLWLRKVIQCIVIQYTGCCNIVFNKIMSGESITSKDTLKPLAIAINPWAMASL